MSGRKNNIFKGIITLLFVMIFSFPANAITDDDSLFALVMDYYQWAIVNGKHISEYAPKIQQVKGSTHFYLDTSTLPKFIETFMASGFFSPEFPSAVKRYYLKYKKEFEGLSEKEFAQYAHDGRGPMMEVEDMDIFFCAQEYEYRTDFIRSFKRVKADISESKATMIVKSPYGWETNFHFINKDNKWLISGYCVYQ